MKKKEFQNLSEDQKLALFKVEELENRLEMASLSARDASSGILEAYGPNGVCWIAQ